MKALIANVAEDAEGKLWFFENMYQFVGYFMEDSCQMHVVAECPKELSFFSALNIYLVQSTLFISSQYSPELLIYDISKNRFRLYQCNTKDNASQYDTVFWNDKIIFFPVETECSTYIFSIHEKKYKKVNWIEQEDMFEKTGQIYQEKEKVWMPMLNKNIILQFCLENNQYEKIILSEDVHLKALCKKNNDLWLAQYDSMTILKYNCECCEQIVLKKSNTNIKEPFSKIFFVGQKCIVMPRFSEIIFVYDTDNGDITEIALPYKKSESKSVISLLYGFFISRKELFFLPWRRPRIFKLELRNYNLREFKMEVDSSDYIKIAIRNTLFEGDRGDLKELYRRSGEKDSNDFNGKLRIGRHIFDKLK